MILVLWSSIGAGGGDESFVTIDLKYGDGMLPATKGSVERQLYAIEISVAITEMCHKLTLG